VSYLLLYPLLYHYILNFFNDRKTLILERSKFLFPILTALLVLTLYLPISAEQKAFFIRFPYFFDFGENWPVALFNVLIFLFYYLQALWFFYLFFRLYQVNLEHYYQSFSRHVPRWLFTALMASILYEFSYTTLLVLSPAAYSPWLQGLSLTFIIFFGFLGLYHDDIVLMVKMEKMAAANTIPRVKPSPDLALFDAEMQKSIKEAIESLMKEQKLFRNPGLKLEHLAKRLHLPKQQLSVFINQYYRMNFTQLINSFRIDYAKEILNDPDETRPLEQLFPDFGFYSRSTFNRVFKAATGLSPAEFRQQKSA
jgi:AraC-like DNA-binding protein